MPRFPSGHSRFGKRLKVSIPDRTTHPLILLLMIVSFLWSLQPNLESPREAASVMDYSDGFQRWMHNDSIASLSQLGNNCYCVPWSAIPNNICPIYDRSLKLWEVYTSTNVYDGYGLNLSRRSQSFECSRIGSTLEELTYVRNFRNAVCLNTNPGFLVLFPPSLQEDLFIVITTIFTWLVLVRSLLLCLQIFTNVIWVTGLTQLAQNRTNQIKLTDPTLLPESLNFTDLARLM
jgi:hypothetical protein